MIKTSEKHKLRDILQNNSPELLKTVRVIKNKTVYETTSTRDLGWVLPESEDKSICPLLSEENAFCPLPSTQTERDEGHKAWETILFPPAVAWAIGKFDSPW